MPCSLGWIQTHIWVSMTRIGNKKKSSSGFVAQLCPSPCQKVIPNRCKHGLTNGNNFPHHVAIVIALPGDAEEATSGPHQCFLLH